MSETPQITEPTVYDLIRKARIQTQWKRFENKLMKLEVNRKFIEELLVSIVDECSRGGCIRMSTMSIELREALVDGGFKVDHKSKVGGLNSTKLMSWFEISLPEG